MSRRWCWRTEARACFDMLDGRARQAFAQELRVALAYEVAEEGDDAADARHHLAAEPQGRGGRRA